MSASTQTGDAPKINPPPVNGHATKKTSKKGKPNTGARKLRNLSPPTPSAANRPTPVMTKPIPQPAGGAKVLPFSPIATTSAYLIRREAELVSERALIDGRIAEVRRMMTSGSSSVARPKVKAKRRTKKAPAKMAA